jgi:hypothetical protein
MGSRLLDLFRLGRCSHEFSWPRRWPDGDYYQVCLLCGEEYRYDWNTMSRQERVVGGRRVQEPPRAGARQGRPCTRKKASWSPRARRIRLYDQEMKYREVGTAAWRLAMVENVSQTGVLFRANEVLADNAEVELILKMPREITGVDHAKVLARGMVVRSVPPQNGKGKAAIAAGIWDYRVLHDKKEESPESPLPAPEGPLDL